MDSEVFFVARFLVMKNAAGGGPPQLSVFSLALKSIPDFLFREGKQSFVFLPLLILRRFPLTETSS